MIYNSNGNNVPYQSGGNAKVQKELKALEEAINALDADFNDYVGSAPDNFNNTGRVQQLRTDVDAIDTSINGTGGISSRLGTVETSLGNLGTQVDTATANITNANISGKVKASKYLFDYATTVTGTNICKINAGSQVYVTNGTDSILVDYTAGDAWVAKAKLSGSKKFRLYENGTLTCTSSSGWSIYVIGNDVSATSVTGSYTEIVTGITIGGTLYAALARNYTFDTIQVSDTANVNALIVTNSITAPRMEATNLAAGAVETTNLIANNSINANYLKNAKRNIQDEVNGKVIIGSHPTNVQVYIGVRKFTGTYNLKLVKNINGTNVSLFTATIVWNGKDPIVQYHEYKDNEPVDYLYSMVLTDDTLYFVTQGDGSLYYSYDVFGDGAAPTSSEYPNIPYQPNDVIADYITQYEDRTVFFGDHTEYSGVDILGKLNADYIALDGIDYENITVSGNTSLHDTTIDGTLSQTGNASFSGVVTIGDLE